MKYQFLYGRMNTGYCQLNQDYFVESKKDLMQLEALQNYQLVDGSDIRNLPLEYYAYADEIGGECVWIEGLTSFVPAGTSPESGSRDTSMIHKYIYTGEDYEKHIRAEAENGRRKFYSTVEGYQQGIGEDIELVCREIKFVSLQQYFGFNEDQLEDFIVCCLDAFPRAEKRVYCYLPSADRTGSLYAKCLMETLLKVLPPCVNVGTGFITYSSTFHNTSINPIPGNISVVFIPDTFENRQREISEKNKNYIFDFKHYEKQKRMDTIEYIRPVVKNIIEDMKIGHQEKNLAIYNKLIQFVKNDVAVGADFLGFFNMHLSFSVKLKDLVRTDDQKIKYTIAKAVGKLLEFENTLTESGKEGLRREVDMMLQHCQYSEEDLKWISVIYHSGELCRNYIIESLCDVCIKFAEEMPRNRNEKILTITNYEYTDEELNAHILSLIYSEEKYFQVGQRLIYEILNPLKEDFEKANAKKRTLFFTWVAGLYKKYPGFVTSVYFIDEAADFLVDFFDKADDIKEEMMAIRENIKKMDEPFQTAYYPVLQHLSYLEVQEFIFSGQSRAAEEYELEYYENLIQQYCLEEYENKNIGETYIDRFEDTIREKKFDRVFASGNVRAILREFESFPFKNAVDYCKRNILKVEGCLDRYETIAGQENFSDWKDLFFYFYCTEDGRIMERCLSFILKQENLTCLIEFCRNVHPRMNTREYGSEKRIVRKVIEYYKDTCIRQGISSSDKEFLLDMGVRGVTKFSSELSRAEEQSAKLSNGQRTGQNNDLGSGYYDKRKDYTNKTDKDFEYGYDREYDYDRKEDFLGKADGECDESDLKVDFMDQNDKKSKEKTHSKSEKKKGVSKTGMFVVNKLLKKN